MKVEPYKFLDYYEEGDQELFFGRSRETEVLVARVARERAFVLYGRSGVGKTSLLRAGILPILRKRGFLPVVVRVGSDPSLDVAAAVVEAAHLDASLARDLPGAIRAAAAQKPLVVVLDQFEEMFIRLARDAKERATFIDTLGEVLADSTVNMRVVFSLREDYVAELDAFRPVMPDLFGGAERLLPLTAFGAREAIVKPLLKLKIPFSPRFVEALLADLAGEGFDPPSLQIACFEVYERARSGPSPRLDESTYEELGRLRGIFESYFVGVGASIAPEKKLLVAIVVDALVTRERTKRATTVRQLLGNDDAGATADVPRFRATEKELDEVLALLASHRLVRRDPRGSDIWYELSHEHVIPGALGWLDRDRHFPGFRAARDLLRYAAPVPSWRKEHEVLLNVGQLRDVVWPYRARLRPDPQETWLLFWSAVYRLREEPLCELDVRHWANVLGADLALEENGKLLANENPKMRAAAALAAGYLKPPPELRQALVTRALDDAVAEVRTAANQSLARVAGPDEIAVLVRASSEPKHAVRALETLSYLGEEGRGKGQLPFLARLRARRIAHERAKEVHAETIRKRRNAGAALGAVVGIAWLVAIGIPVGALLAFGTSTDPNDTVVALLWIGVPTCAGFGALFGAFAGGGAAVSAAIRGKEHWEDGAARPGFRLLLSPLVLLGASLTVFAVGAKNPFGDGLVLVIPLIWLLALRGMRDLLGAVRKAAGPAPGPRGVAPWVFAGFAALLLVLGAVTLLDRPFDVDFEMGMSGLMVLFATLSVAFGAGTLAAVAGARNKPLGDLPSVSFKSSRTAVGTLGGLGVMGLVGISQVTSLGGLPWLQGTVPVSREGETTLVIEAPRSNLGVRRRLFTMPEGGLFFGTVELPQGSMGLQINKLLMGSFGTESDASPRSETWVFAPGDHELAFAPKGEPWGTTQQAKLVFRALPFERPAAGQTLALREEQTLLVTLTPDSHDESDVADAGAGPEVRMSTALGFSCAEDTELRLLGLAERLSGQNVLADLTIDIEVSARGDVGRLTGPRSAWGLGAIEKKLAMAVVGYSDKALPVLLDRMDGDNRALCGPLGFQVRLSAPAPLAKTGGAEALEVLLLVRRGRPAAE